jgi:predicted O-methyltransferase YrrM
MDEAGHRNSQSSWPGAFATFTYQLRSLWLILLNYPTPGILARYIGHYVGRLARVVSSNGRPEVESVERRYSALVEKRNFTSDWFSKNIPIWTSKLATFKQQHPSPEILEIGSYEGRSTLFFLTHFPESRLTVVDMWGGNDESAGGPMVSPVEARFDSNVGEYKARITKMRGKSAECLGRLVATPKQFDLIYVDGSHYADDVIVDAALSWSLLRAGGTMIFDDYIYVDYRYGARKSSCRAINLFLRLIAGEYRVEHVAHQIIIEKIYSMRSEPG